MLIKRLAVPVRRDVVETTTAEVGEHEIDVLKAVHGEGAVLEEMIADTGDVIEIESAAAEYDRLVRVYGRHAEERRDYVALAYGSDREFARALAEFSGEPIPVAPSKSKKAAATA